MDDHEPTAKPSPPPVPETAVEPPAPAPVGPPSIVDGQDHPVDPRSVKVARMIGVPLTGLIGILPSIFITLGWALGGIPSVVYLPLLAGLLLLLGAALTFAYKWPGARHRRLSYRVDPTGVRIRRGVFWRKVIWIPITRVQHTDVSQGPLQRKFELATLTVHTAGTEGASIPLAGLEHGIATRLCDHLRPDRESDAG